MIEKGKGHGRGALQATQRSVHWQIAEWHDTGGKKYEAQRASKEGEVEGKKYEGQRASKEGEVEGPRQ